MKESLELQLGALKKSLEYEADVANFLEPWYGIGYIAGSFGGSYEFPQNQSPINMLSYLLPVTELFMEIYDDPEGVKKGAKLLSELLREVIRECRRLAGLSREVSQTVTFTVVTTNCEKSAEAIVGQALKLLLR